VSSAGWTPYEGMAMRGRVRATVVRGRTVFDGERVTSSTGNGEYIKPCP
jgi:allantoinase